MHIPVGLGYRTLHGLLGVPCGSMTTTPKDTADWHCITSLHRFLSAAFMLIEQKG